MTPPAPLTQLIVLGSPRLKRGGDAPAALGPKLAGLLAWLGLAGPQTRAGAVALFYPGLDAAAARRNLRQLLFQHRALLAGVLHSRGDQLALAESVQVDAAGTPGAEPAAEPPALLGSLRFDELPEFQRWLDAQREWLRARRHDALAGLASAHEQAGRLADALALAHQLVAELPGSEHAHRRLMRLHYLRGDRAAALAAFDRCEQILKHELGARPGDETLALLATIEAAQVAAAPPVRRAMPPSIQRPPRMVGRDAELALLEQAWAAAQVAAVIGEAGLGKSRLLQDFMAARPRLVYAAGRPGDSGVPFATLARLLRAVAQGGPRGERPAWPADARRDIARVLPELGEPAPPPRDSQRLALQRAVAACLQADPALDGVLLDDLHFADEASLEMIQALLDPEPGAAAPRPRWALAFRPAEAGTPVHRLQDSLVESARLVPVAVQPLDEPALARLVDELGLPGVRGAALAPMLRRRTGGNPLFVLETIKQAWAEQALDSLADPAALPRPASVGRLIKQRIGQLSPGALALARVASIAGVDFGIALAEAVLGASAMQFADALNELEAAQVLKGTQFAHDLVFYAVLRSVPRAIAEHTHAQVAGWLEQHAGEPARIAQHWIAGAQPLRALPWLAQAAERARRALRNAEHLQFLDLHADIEQAQGLHEQAFATRLATTEAYADIGQSYDRHDALDLLAGTERQRIAAWLARAFLATRRMEPEIARTHARQALEAAQRVGDTTWIRRSQARLFEALIVGDRAEEALALGEACLAWIDVDFDVAQRVSFHAALAILYDNTGQLSKGLAQHEQARALADEGLGVERLAVLANNMANNMAFAGRLRRSLPLRLESLRLGSQLEQLTANDGIAATQLAGACTLLGHFADALHWSGQAEAALRDAVPATVPLAQVHRAWCWWHLGQKARALQLLDRIAAQPSAVSGARVRQHLLRHRIEREQGRPGEPALQAGLAALQPGSFPNLREMLLIERAHALPPAEALAALAQARERALRCEFGGHVLETHLRAAQVALAIDPPLARRHALEALRLSDEFDLILSYRGELWLRGAEALLAAGDGAQGRDVLGRGLDWLQATAREHVPAEFRDGFLHRNPTNRALLALAARQGMPAGGRGALT